MICEERDDLRGGVARLRRRSRKRQPHHGDDREPDPGSGVELSSLRVCNCHLPLLHLGSPSRDRRRGGGRQRSDNDAGREHLNFAEQATDPARFYTPEASDRLRRVKAQYDPDDVFRANHEIPPAP
ncbi:MAG: hypothetical protein E6G07_06660 [Actinobacteria bacterium]|nr:MAG: hypothetical protein E6G07_06660 [Actinomycetota bacterium]